MSIASRRRLRSYVNKIEALVAEGSTQTARVEYVATAKAKSAKPDLPRRSQQALAVIQRRKRASRKDLQKAMRVNRNVVSGAVFPLLQAKVIRAEHVSA